MRTFLTFAILASLTTFAPAQAAGLRGAAQETSQVERLGPPDPGTSERVITIEAVAEVRVVPSSLRVVFAVSAQGATASMASEAGRALLAEAQKQLTEAGISEQDIDVDFIAAMPVYAWQVEQQNGKDVVAEKRVGMRVQYNLQVSVADEAAALVAIEAASARNDVDLLAVDYWSDELANKQIEAQKKALAAAQEKSKLLLSVFPQPPMMINVSETTQVLFPQQLYQTLPAAESSTGTWYSTGNMPRVPAPRPMLIYYRGLFGNVDAVESIMPGKREIEVVSTVRLYYAAPGRPELAD